MNQTSAALTTSRNDSTPHPPQPPARLLLHVLWITLAVLVFAPTVLWLWQRWTMDVWHNVHGLFVPFLLVYFGYQVLRRDPVREPEQSAWGFLLIGLGLLLVVLDSAIGTQLLSAVGLVVCLPGLSLLLLGRRRTKALAFVWLLSVFMLPIPAAFIESFILLLRRITAFGVEHLISLFGLPVAREDTLLFLPGANMSITDGCSGFSVLYASLALALVLAYINPSWRTRVLTLALAIPVAITCNLLRCTLLSLLVQRWGGGIMDTAVHPLSGMLTFTAAAALLTYIGTSGMRRLRA
jgi:exosortase